MLTDRAQLQDWFQLIRAEYEELPNLQLTQSEVEELWALDAETAEALLGALVSVGALTKTREGAYVRARAR
jgi:hypothetical protein